LDVTLGVFVVGKIALPVLSSIREVRNKFIAETALQFLHLLSPEHLFDLLAFECVSVVTVYCVLTNGLNEVCTLLLREQTQLEEPDCQVDLRNNVQTEAWVTHSLK
jgi:hypothetical protein